VPEVGSVYLSRAGEGREGERREREEKKKEGGERRRWGYG
jgi:hypothetical protein